MSYFLNSKSHILYSLIIYPAIFEALYNNYDSGVGLSLSAPQLVLPVECFDIINTCIADITVTVKTILEFERRK